MHYSTGIVKKKEMNDKKYEKYAINIKNFVKMLKV